MKKPAMLLLAVALCLGLAGCTSGQPPERAADGSSWDGGWVTVGGVIGVDAPEGMDPRENNEALAANGMYHATWSMGEADPYARGASAFGVYGNCAVSVELTCQEGFDEDASRLLARFLDHCHYAAS